MTSFQACLADHSSLQNGAGRRRLLRLACAPALLLFGTRRASAHHGWSSFDSDKPIYVEGTVKSVRWQNPHAEIIIDVKPGLKLPPDLAARKVPAQTQLVDGAAVLAKAKPPSNPATSWTLELAPLFRVEAWKLAQPAAGTTIAAIGYAAPGEKTAMMRVEYLLLDGKIYGLRSMPTE